MLAKDSTTSGPSIASPIRSLKYAVLLLLSILCSASEAEDWPRMQGPYDNGQIPDQPIRFDWSNELKVIWRIEVGEGYGNAVVSHGRMFHFDRYGDTERLTCYQSNDAKVLWKLDFPVEYSDSFGYNNGPRAMPVSNENYVAALGAVGRLIVADAKTGKLKWQKDTTDLYHVEPNFFGVGSTPCIYNNLLIVMIGGGTGDDQTYGINRLDQRKAGDSAVVAFDLETGNEVYRVGHYLASYSAPTIQKIDGRDHGLAFCREGLLMFDPASGKEIAFYRWRASINESVNAAWPVVHGNEIFISETYEIGSALLRFDGNQLTPLWTDGKSQRSQSFRAHWATPVLIDGVLYGGSGRNEPDSDLRAVEWSTGKVLWTQRTHARANVIAIGNHILSVDELGLTQLIKPNPEKLEVLTQMELFQSTQMPGKELVGAPVWAPPAFADGLLIVRGGRHLVALQLGQ